VNSYFDVCIRGNGPVGQTLALLLAQARLRVALVGSGSPASTEHREDIRAYALNAASRELLQTLRAWPSDATPVQAMQVQGDDGGQLHFSAADQGVQALAWLVPAQALAQQLGQTVSYQAQIEPLDNTQAANLQAQLTVVCEGRASRTREQLGVAFDVHPYDRQAVAARLDCEKPHTGVAYQWFINGEVLALLPLGGPGGNSVALVWSAHTAHALQLMAQSAEVFAQAVQQACGAALGAMHLQSERAAWPLQLARAQRMVGPGWALAGDAAHSVHPLSGQGLNLGLADAKALAEVLQGREYWRGLGDEKLLRRYERAASARVAQIVGLTDGLHHIFANDAPWLQGLRNRGMNGFNALGPLKHWAVGKALG
jgi:ubiquinone biosynthesis UbiH/UbiF/VisC/COQ6 family hydroxylase